ncbi:MAG: DEAD/DEAH box helicase [Planctomycetota bacterium]|nr:MAG: DEAD/DEAH box helicase [Planctomycetota bacterium]
MNTKSYKGLVLDRFQREALEAIDRGENVIVAAPTGAGKTLVAEYAIEQVLARGGRAIYTAPIKALSNQKYRDLSAAYPGKVGISTGDVSIDPGAPVVIMTTEIFRNTIFDDPQRAAQTSWVIFDEVHYLDDPERGTVWEESLIFAPPSVKVLALSATVSNLDELADWMREVREGPVRVVLETRRPVPLAVKVSSTEGKVVPLERVRELRLGRRQFQRMRHQRRQDVRGYYLAAQRKLVATVLNRRELPLLFFLYSRAACGQLARACRDLDLHATYAEGKAARAEFDRLIHAFELDPKDEETRALGELVGHGIAYHHAGLLPPLKEVVERLFAEGYLKLLCATETFALGVNMPARSVAFEGLRRWNGVSFVPLKTRQFQQMAGRAGRRGIDPKGTVYITFDPYRDDPSLVTTLVKGKVEPVVSQFNLSYGTLLNLYHRLGDAIYEACERSFANFRARRARATRKSKSKGERKRERRGHNRGRRGRRHEERREREERERAAPSSGARYRSVVEQVRLRLGLLAELGYLDAQGQVTDRGRFAMQVFGHELVVTELVWSGLFKRLDAVALCALAVAVVHESRPGVYYGGKPPRALLGRESYRTAERAVNALVALEEERGIAPPSKPLDWNLSATAAAWAEGAEFAELRDLTDASDGDVVRAFRQAIQVLRLCGVPLRALGRNEEAGRAREALRLLKRGLVDAEWQLRRAAEVPDEPLEPARVSGAPGREDDGADASGAEETPAAAEGGEEEAEVPIEAEPVDPFSDGIF